MFYLETQDHLAINPGVLFRVNMFSYSKQKKKKKETDKQTNLNITERQCKIQFLIFTDTSVSSYKGQELIRSGYGSFPLHDL